MFRLIYIFYLLLKYGFFLILGKYKLKKIQKPKLIRKFFEEAGGTFIKFGQLLALRVDMVSNEYTTEFLGLLDNYKQFSYREVERIFFEELGSYPDRIFKDFQKTPFASASFGQAHAAKLSDGTIVVVKVLRPGIEAKALSDFLIIDLLAFIADLLFKIEALPWKEFAKEFKTWTRQEFDYRIEAENGERFYNNYRNEGKNSKIVIPKIYHHLTTEKILVEDYIEGLHLSRVLKRLRDGRLDEEKLKKMGVDLRKIPRVLVFELLKQFFLHGFYHADPHPGNIILLKNNKIGLIDFGIMGGKGLFPNKNHFIKWAKATGDFNFQEACYHAANFAGDDLKTIIRSALPATIEQKEVDGFMRMLTNNFAHTVQQMIVENKENLESMQKDYTTMFLQVIKSGKKYNIKVPNEFVIFSRCLSIFGLLAKQMDIDFRITDEMKKFFQIYPEEQLIKNYEDTAIKRINREAAIERLSNWLSYLFEVDQPVYHLVKNYLGKYANIDK